MIHKSDKRLFVDARDLHAKDDAVDGIRIERCVARLATPEARLAGIDSHAPSVPQPTSIRAIGNFEIGQIDINAEYLKGVLNSNDAISTNEPPTYSIPAKFAATCQVRIPSPAPKELMHGRLLDEIGNEPGKVRHEGSWAQSFDEAQRGWLGCDRKIPGHPTPPKKSQKIWDPGIPAVWQSAGQLGQLENFPTHCAHCVDHSSHAYSTL